MSFINPLRAAWSRGEVARGAWGAAGSALTVEALAAVGFDYVGIDMQHGAVGYESALGMISAVAGRGSVPIVRVVQNDQALIGLMLDAGALGVVVPMVNSAADAAQAVAACTYPPAGMRSYGPVRASVVTGSRVPADLEEVVCAVMVETVAGLAQLEEIAAVPGVDVIYVGPADLALSLGLPPAYERTEQQHQDAVAKIRRVCDRFGLVAGIHCADGDMASRRIQQGFRMVTFVNDLALLKEKAAEQLAVTR